MCVCVKSVVHIPVQLQAYLALIVYRFTAVLQFFSSSCLGVIDLQPLPPVVLNLEHLFLDAEHQHVSIHFLGLI